MYGEWYQWAALVALALTATYFSIWAYRRKGGW